MAIELHPHAKNHTHWFVLSGCEHQLEMDNTDVCMVFLVGLWDDYVWVAEG